MEEKIINHQELGKKFFCYSFGQYFVYNSCLKPEEIKIDYCLVVADNSVYSNNSMRAMANGIIGAILAGVVGVFVAAAISQTKWNIDIDIYTTDGRVIEINTTQEKMIKKLIKYVRHPDPRTRYRKQRGVI